MYAPVRKHDYSGAAGGSFSQPSSINWKPLGRKYYKFVKAEREASRRGAYERGTTTMPERQGWSGVIEERRGRMLPYRRPAGHAQRFVPSRYTPLELNYNDPQKARFAAAYARSQRPDPGPSGLLGIFPSRYDGPTDAKIAELKIGQRYDTGVYQYDGDRYWQEYRKQQAALMPPQRTLPPAVTWGPAVDDMRRRQPFEPFNDQEMVPPMYPMPIGPTWRGQEAPGRGPGDDYEGPLDFLEPVQPIERESKRSSRVRQFAAEVTNAFDNARIRKDLVGVAERFNKIYNTFSREERAELDKRTLPAAMAAKARIEAAEHAAGESADGEFGDEKSPRAERYEQLPLASPVRANYFRERGQELRENADRVLREGRPQPGDLRELSASARDDDARAARAETGSTGATGAPRPTGTGLAKEFRINRGGIARMPGQRSTSMSDPPSHVDPRDQTRFNRDLDKLPITQGGFKLPPNPHVRGLDTQNWSDRSVPHISSETLKPRITGPNSIVYE